MKDTKPSIQELIAQSEEAMKSEECGAITSTKRVVSRLNSTFDKRIFNKRFLKSRTLQKWSDAYIIDHLDEAVQAYNAAVDSYRETHKVTPTARYHLEPKDKWSIDCRGDCGLVEVAKIDELDPLMIDRILIRDITYSDGGLCGYCGDKISTEKEQRFHFHKPGFLGIGARVDVCGDEECVKMGIANYARDTQMWNEITGALNGVFEKAAGMDHLTEIQKNWRINQAYEELRRNCEGQDVTR